MANRSVIIFVFVWFIFVLWGLELGVNIVFLILNGTWKSQTIGQYLAKVWSINILRAGSLILMLRWLKIGAKDLFKGPFGCKEFLLSTVGVLIFLSVEVAYFGNGYIPQVIREFHHHLRLAGGNSALVLLALTSQYACYYVLEITAVNLLYVGVLALSGKRAALVAPSILWGFAHILNIVAEMSPLESLLLGIYMALFALTTYWIAQRYGSLKVPVYMWLVSMSL